MILTPLGHTEFLLDIENSHNENIRILVDSWLSDFSLGDLMERNVHVRLDPEKLATLDILYISHAHTDHLDPYTLKKIYQYANPVLMIPFTLEYLIPLLRDILGEIVIRVLFPGKIEIFRDIRLTGHMFSQSEITNEDDVMMLSIENGKEFLFAEIDTLPPADDLAVQEELVRIFSEKSYETCCYLATRNELEGQLPFLEIPEKRRQSYRSEYISQRKEEMYFSYNKYEYDDFSNLENIYNIPGFVRGFIGQGIVYPEILSSELAYLQIFPLPEMASMEADIAQTCGYNFPQKALNPGRQYKIEHGQIETGRKECPLGELILSRESLESNEGQSHRVYAVGPLFPRDHIDIESAKHSLNEILHTRFLPYWSASSLAPLRDALIKNGGIYRIGFKTPTKHEQIIYEYSTARASFIEIPYIPGAPLDEEYWLEDILDFLEGRQDLYSNFWHKLNPKMIYRLWTCLGANFMNHDLVEKKYTLHFGRAKTGETVENWIQPLMSRLSHTKN